MVWRDGLELCGLFRGGISLDGMVNFFGGGGYVGWFFIFIFWV